MVNSTNKYKYKLETHLKLLCEENKEYTNLYSSWALNKTTYTNILSTIQINYPHYSLHDASHSESIITNIEMLLGEEGISKLSPTDTWMILNCSYLHDFGMALLHSNIEEEWKSPEFKRYLNNITNSSDKDLKVAAKYIIELKDNINNDDFELGWPVKIRKYVTEIIASYFRRKHSSITKEYLNKLEDWKLDLTQNGLIHNRLIKLVGEISFLHSQSFEEVLKLDYISNGYNSDYIHPRFIAELIRLGDLLDLDNGRFSEYIEKVTGEMPSISKLHKEKHRATSHVLITPYEIEVRVDCSDYAVYREARNWISWIQEEIKNITIRWTEIIPKNLDWYAPKLTKKELLIKGEPDVNNISDLRFEISQKKAFEIIEGSNLYENKLAFLREFVQNALDASKVQMWRDITDGLYDSWINKPITDLTPFDVNQKIYENYKIKIKVDTTDKEHIEVTIADRGTGISLEILKNMCNVGSSYSGTVKLQQEVEDMPSWLKPTGGFGIGMQSGFLVTDNFKAYTKSVGMDTLEIKFEPATIDGYISVRNTDNKIKRGTEMNILVPEISKFKYNLGSRVDEFINNRYDPLENQSLTFYNIIDYIYDNLETTLFPIEIYIDDELNTIESFTQKEKYKFDEDDNQYLYCIPNDLSHIVLWNKKESVYIDISINNYDLKHTNFNVFFKGCKLSKEKGYRQKGFNIVVDIYGFDTKSTLKIDRSQLTEEGSKKLSNIVDNAISFYLNKLRLKLDEQLNKEIQIDEFKENTKLDIFKFIVLCSQNEKMKDFNPKKYEKLFNIEDFKFKALFRENMEFKEILIPFKEIIGDYPNLTYMNVYDFTNNLMGKEECNYDVITKLFNQNLKNIEENMIIIDKYLVDIISIFFIEKINYVNAEKEIFIYTINTNNSSEKVRTDSETKKHFIKALAVEGNIGYVKYGQNTVRCSIPVIGGYEELAVKRSFYRIYEKHNTKFRIISPITKYDRANLNNFGNKEIFIKHIIKREDYKNLVDFVFENQVFEDKVSKERISTLYQQLIGEFFETIKGK